MRSSILYKLQITVDFATCSLLHDKFSYSLDTFVVFQRNSFCFFFDAIVTTTTVFWSTSGCIISLQNHWLNGTSVLISGKRTTSTQVCLQEVLTQHKNNESLSSPFAIFVFVSVFRCRRGWGGSHWRRRLVWLILYGLSWELWVLGFQGRVRE